MMRLCLFRMAGLVYLLVQTRALGDLALSILTLEYLAIPSLPFALLVVGMQVLFFLTQLAAGMVLIVWIINKIGFQGEKPESARPRFTPSYAAPVDIIIFPCREPLAVIERTLMATTQIDWLLTSSTSISLTTAMIQQFDSWSSRPPATTKRSAEWPISTVKVVLPPSRGTSCSPLRPLPSTVAALSWS